MKSVAQKRGFSLQTLNSTSEIKIVPLSILLKQLMSFRQNLLSGSYLVQSGNVASKSVKLGKPMGEQSLVTVGNQTTNLYVLR
mmetsp:Transcript_71598/g.99469  ORF Transcript_71598/g.99469 Transcript_71598/m.99469 type:complete len:83 (+) Transcript_71598:200-448(+)